MNFRANNSVDLLASVLDKYSTDMKIGLVIGENVDVGSHISGLSAFLKTQAEPPCFEITNAPNCESITAGIAIDYSWRTGKSTCIFVKQLDFLTLYIDDLIHTVNLYSGMGRSFNVNIISYVVDVGNEGYQSGLDRIYSLARLIRVEPFFVTSYTSSRRFLEELGKPGIKLQILSQRFGRSSFNPALDIERIFDHRTGANKVDIFIDFSCYANVINLNNSKWVYAASHSELIELMASMTSTEITIHTSFGEFEHYLKSPKFCEIARDNELIIDAEFHQEYSYEHGTRR